MLPNLETVCYCIETSFMDPYGLPFYAFKGTTLAFSTGSSERRA
jgi:hypothetical protein